MVLVWVPRKCCFPAVPALSSLAVFWSPERAWEVRAPRFQSLPLFARPLTLGVVQDRGGPKQPYLLTRRKQPCPETLAYSPFVSRANLQPLQPNNLSPMPNRRAPRLFQIAFRSTQPWYAKQPPQDGLAGLPCQTVIRVAMLNRSAS